jgi:ABC-type antimicrobial peptide transport system permease subunit
MDQEMASSVAAPKFNTFVLGLFAFLALFLAAIGIYGVLAYAVAQQSHEISIRMALGAQRRHVMRLVLVQGACLALAGTAIGLLAAFGLTRLMSSLLYGISASDPLTFAAVAIACRCRSPRLLHSRAPRDARRSHGRAEIRVVRRATNRQPFPSTAAHKRTGVVDTPGDCARVTGLTRK